MEFISKNTNDTIRLMVETAHRFNGGDVVALYGDLGSGKTTSVKAIAAELGLKEPITSPTFVIMKNYSIPMSSQGILELVHLDAYRLHGAPDAESIGLSEYFGRDDVLIFIEWPENIENILPHNIKKIHFEHLEGDKRKIVINF